LSSFTKNAIEQGRSTFFPNSLEMVAAMKCIDILERENVTESLWLRGTEWLARLRGLVEESGVPCTVSGIPPMPFVTFDRADDKYKERRTAFYTETVRRGLFIQPFHHWYIAHRHTDADLEKALWAIGEALEYVKERYPRG